MKVTFSLPVYWPAIGGCEFLTHELVRILSERNGVEIQVITQIDDQLKKIRAPLWFNTTCYAEGKDRSYVENDVRIHLLGLGRVLRKGLYPFVRYHHRFQRFSMKVIVRAFRRKFIEVTRETDLVHCIHNGLSYYGILSLAVARQIGVPFVFSPTLHLFHEGWHGEMMRAIDEGKDFRILPQLHLKPRGYHDRFWLELCHEADALVTWTGFEGDFFADMGIPRDKIFSLRLGPVISREETDIDLSRKYGIKENVPVILFLGRNHEFKGIEELLKAASIVWEKMPETHFLFIGPKEGISGEIFERYRDQRVAVIDKVTDGEKTEFIKRCDVFCVPSLHESFGIVFLEAWYYGKPIIAADIPPIRELNPGDRGGFLIRPTPEEIAGSILRLLEDDSLRRKMGEWGKKRVNSIYRWDNAADQLTDVYKGLLER